VRALATVTGIILLGGLSFAGMRYIFDHLPMFGWQSQFQTLLATFIVVGLVAIFVQKKRSGASVFLALSHAGISLVTSAAIVVPSIFLGSGIYLFLVGR
jgi:hypothetical protein